MRFLYFLLFPLFTVCAHCCIAQNNCCDDAACRVKSQDLAAQIIPLIHFVGETNTDDASVNDSLLRKAFQKDQIRYNSFKSLIYEILRFTDDSSHDHCFKTFLTSEQYITINHWLVYFNDLKNPVSFPSPEFCQGFRTRIEINQGAANFLKNDMAFLGSVRGLVSYTFGKKESCGNRVRLLAGPAYFLQNKIGYATLNTRLAYRLKDIMVKNPPVFLGNWNLFADYATSFHHFNYAGVGAEAQLGPFGVNVLANYNLDSKHLGFLFGIFLSNKKKK